MARQFSMVPPDSIIRAARALGQGDAPLALFAYLRSGPHANSLGVSRIPLLYIAADLGRDECWVKNNLEKLADAGLVIRDEQHDLILVVGQLCEEGLSNPNQVSFARKCVAGLPSSSSQGVFECLLEQAEGLGRDFIAPLVQDLKGRLGETHTERFAYGLQTQRQDTDKKTEKNTNKPAAAPPRLLALDGGKKRVEERTLDRKESAKERRTRFFREAQEAYPVAFERQLSGEVSGRNAYTKDLKNFQELGFNSEAELHRQVLASIQAHTASPAWSAEGGKYIPGIGRFLKDRRWRSKPGSAQGPLDQLSRAGRATAENAARALEEMGGASA